MVRVRRVALRLLTAQWQSQVEDEPSQLAFQLVGRLGAASPCAEAARARLAAGTIATGDGHRQVSFIPRVNLLRSVDGPLRSTMAAHTDWVRCVTLSGPDDNTRLGTWSAQLCQMCDLAKSRSVRIC